MTEHTARLTGHSRYLQAWIDWMTTDHSEAGLTKILADDVTFLSPVVHTPQQGKAITLKYLLAAGDTLGGDTFHYTRIFDCDNNAVLEFECIMDGIKVNGVDMIEWNAAGQITEFKVMVRPLKAIQTVHAAMGAQLAKMQKQ